MCALYVYHEKPLSLDITPNLNFYSRLFLILLDPKFFQTALDYSRPKFFQTALDYSRPKFFQTALDYSRPIT